MSKHFRRAVPADFVLHKPIRWPLYDEGGVLLLKQGYVITMPGLVERLLERGCYIGLPNIEPERLFHIPANGGEEDKKAGAADDAQAKARKADQGPAFFRAGDLATSIRRIHKLLCEPPSPRISVKDYVQERAEQLIALVEEDADAVLASAYLSTEIRDYRPGHQLLGAAITALLAPQCEIEPAHRRALVCAALTRDVGLNDFDKISGGFAKGLPEIARARVQEHTEYSVRILGSHGVHDPLWLRYVREHHERPDGAGYPGGLRTGQALPGSFLLNLADSYASMVLPSERAPGKFPANAMKELFLEKGSRYAEQHVAALFKTLTRFPAGTLVSLASGETCLVKNTPAANSQPVVYSIYDRSGMPRSSPVLRDTGVSEFNITGCVSPSKCQSAALVIRRLWHAAS